MYHQIKEKTLFSNYTNHNHVHKYISKFPSKLKKEESLEEGVE